MKKIAVFIIITAFALRPAYYVGHVLYYQLNIDYIIETYCINKDKPELQCNGKCHLAKQLAVVNTVNDEDGNKAIINLYESFFPVFSEQQRDFVFKDFLPESSKNKIVFRAQIYKFSFESFHFKPPIV